LIAYHHHLFFLNEPQFNFSLSNVIYDIIYIKKHISLSFLDRMKFKTEWQILSGERIRYIVEKPFSTKSKNISWALEIENVIILFWDTSKKEILYYQEKNYEPNKLLFWILHTFFPLVIEFESICKILHVGGVEISGKSILFSAHSYGGKSTLTNYFLSKGHRLLSDDAIGITKENDSYYIIPSHPYYRPYREIGTLGHITDNFSFNPILLQHIYVLQKVDATDLVQIKEIHGIEKFKALYASGFVMFNFMQKERFDFFTSMSQYITVYSISVPWNLERLDDVYQSIILHTATSISEL